MAEHDRVAGPVAAFPVSVAGSHVVQSWPINALPWDVREKWLTFLAASAGPNPVRQAPASLAVTAALNPGSTIEILGVRDGSGEIVGIQPIQRGSLSLKFNVRHRSIVALPIAGVSLIGSEPLSARHVDKVFVLRCVLKHLQHDRAIEFNELERGSTIEREVRQFAQPGWKLHPTDHPGSWTYADVPASMAAYTAGLGKKKLYNLKRQSRLLAEHLGGELELVVVRTAADLGMLNAAMRQMTGWNAKRLRWAERHAELACREGVACFFVLKSADRLVGLVRATAWGDKLHVQSMHRDGTLDKFSPGTALWQAVLNWTIDGGVIRRVIFNYGTPMPGNRALNVVQDRAHVLVVRPMGADAVMIALHRAFIDGKSRLGRARTAWRARSVHRTAAATAG